MEILKYIISKYLYISIIYKAIFRKIKIVTLQNINHNCNNYFNNIIGVVM